MFNNSSLFYFSYIDTTNAIDMSYMFKNCSELKNLDFISYFNIKKRNI